MGLFSKDDKKKQDPLEQLQHLVPLNTLSSADLLTLKDNSSFQSVKKGDFLFSAGDTDPHNIYLLEGELVLLSADQQELESITPDSPTARFPIAHELPRKVSARARKPSQVVLIDNHLLSKFLSVGSESSYEVSDEMGGEDDWMTQLLKSDVFQRLPASSIQGVMMSMNELKVAKGEKIIIEGEVGDYYYLLHRGKADVIVGGKILNRLGAGDRFGEDALLSGFPRNATIAMLGDSVLMRLSREDFLRYVQNPLNNQIDFASAAGMVSAEGAVWMDIRTPQEFAQGHVEGAINIPFEGFRSRLGGLVDEKTYICYGMDDKKSSAAAFTLIDRGYNAYYLHPGLPKGQLTTSPAAAKPAAPAPPATPTAPPPAPAKGASEDVAALKRRLAEAESQSREYLEKLKRAKAAIDRSKEKRASDRKAQEQREAERKKMRDTLMTLKSSLETKSSELERTRAHAEEAAQMRKRLERMDSLISKESGGVPQNKLRESEQAFHEQLSQQEAKHGSLESELSEALNRLEDMESQRSKSNDLRRQLEAAQARQEAAIDQVSHLQGQEQSAYSALAQAEERTRTLEAQLQQQSATATTPQQRMALEEQRKQVEIARLERDQAQKQLDQLQQQQQKRQQEIEHYGTQVQKFQQQIEKLEHQERAQEEEYKRTLSTLERQLEEVKVSQEKAEESARSMEEERKRMAQELEKARQQLKEVENRAGGEVAKLQQELEETRKRMEAQARSGGATSAEQQESKRKLTTLQSHLKKQQEALERSEQEREGLKEFLESRSDELHDLKRALTDAQVEAEEADFRRQEAEEARKQVEDALSRLHEQVESERGKGGTLEYDEEGNEVFVEKKSKSGLVVVLLVLLIAGGGGGYWYLTQPPAPPVSERPRPSEPPPVSEPGDTPAEPVVQEPREPTRPVETVDRSGEPASGTPWRESLAVGREGPRLVYVRGGEFTMGNLADPWVQDENPTHHVRLGSFWAGQFEVTFEEYDAFVAATNRRRPNDNGFGRGDRPVINVTWDDAVAYTRWLSEQTGATYRLPSEAEWEYLARAGSKTDYWWGSSPGINRANCFNCSSQWDGRVTAPVGTFRPNDYNIYNTAGNVMEWVQDCYRPNYRHSSGDATPWERSGCTSRTARGGAYNRPAQSMRSSKREEIDQSTAIPNLGFRVVRDIN